MSAGTLTLTNNSAAVTGSGTTFSTEIAAGDFIVVTVGGTSYTRPVLAVNSDTSLTLISNYFGPTQSGVAWHSVPRVALNMITAAIVVQNEEALRGLNYDKQNWQQFFTADGDVTITLPDTSQTTGPSAKKLITITSGKAGKGANSDITSLSGLTTPLSMEQGGLGANTPEGGRASLGLKGASTCDIGTAAGTVAAGNDPRIMGAVQKTGSAVSGMLDFNTAPSTDNDGEAVVVRGIHSQGSGAEIVNNALKIFSKDNTAFSRLQHRTTTYHSTRLVVATASGAATFEFAQTGNAIASGSWVNSGCDERIKDRITPISNPREILMDIRAATWLYRHEGADGRFGIGVIANDIARHFPEAVINTGSRKLANGEVIDDVLAVEAGDSGAMVAVHHAVLQSLVEENNTQQGEIDQMKKDMEALKILVNKLTA